MASDSEQHERPSPWCNFSILGIAITGCQYFPEATFSLAGDSRMPRWTVLSPGVLRANVSLTMKHYITPWGRSAQFLLQDPNNQVINKQKGKLKCAESFRLEKPSPGFPPGFPAYEAITVNGITEIIEHRRMESIFYVTDDSAVWKRYESISCD